MASLEDVVSALNRQSDLLDRLVTLMTTAVAPGGSGATTPTGDPGGGGGAATTLGGGSLPGTPQEAAGRIDRKTDSAVDIARGISDAVQDGLTSQGYSLEGYGTYLFQRDAAARAAAGRTISGAPRFDTPQDIEQRRGFAEREAQDEVVLPFHKTDAHGLFPEQSKRIYEDVYAETFGAADEAFDKGTAYDIALRAAGGKGMSNEQIKQQIHAYHDRALRRISEEQRVQKFRLGVAPWEFNNSLGVRRQLAAQVPHTVDGGSAETGKTQNK